MDFDLNTILQPAKKLDWLHDPFTKEEIDTVISQLSTHKSLVPDGFNTDFMKSCWNIIAEQTSTNYVKIFTMKSLCTRSINGSYINLVPKKDSPLTVADYMLISLSNCCVKFITKLMADRSKSAILHLIHQN